MRLKDNTCRNCGKKGLHYVRHGPKLQHQDSHRTKCIFCGTHHKRQLHISFTNEIIDPQPQGDNQ